MLGIALIKDQFNQDCPFDLLDRTHPTREYGCSHGTFIIRHTPSIASYLMLYFGINFHGIKIKLCRK